MRRLNDKFQVDNRLVARVWSPVKSTMARWPRRPWCLLGNQAITMGPLSIVSRKRDTIGETLGAFVSSKDKHINGDSDDRSMYDMVIVVLFDALKAKWSRK